MVISKWMAWASEWPGLQQPRQEAPEQSLRDVYLEEIPKPSLQEEFCRIRKATTTPDSHRVGQQPGLGERREPEGRKIWPTCVSMD